ncbi:MAG: hypothetical protein ASARMPREDX12_000389 [Alectoria sarmentosa]|nr:MAG: hypothetical protein ASARMPREDX12_000389 [Alectoria sarmentosa]
MAKDLVLVTGGSGLTGYACVAHALRAGYRVRTTVRRESAIKEIEGAPTSQEFAANLEVVLVPDMTKDDAFLQALQGVTYVLHVASPMANKTESLDEEHTIAPAIHGTTGILKSALKVPSIKRVVITSTVLVVLGSSDSEVYNETTIQPIPPGPFTAPGPAYFASKRLAYRATRDFIATNKPSYTVVNLMPTYIVGRWELASSSAVLTGGSNGIALSSVIGGSRPYPPPGISVHVTDVARAHVEAMTNEQIKTHEDFILNADGTEGVVWSDAIKIAERHFPEAVAKGILPLGGTTKTARGKADGSKAEKVFGMKMIGFEEQIVSLVGQYVELTEKEQGQKA